MTRAPEDHRAASSTSSTAGGGSSDWAAQAVDTIESVIGTIRSKTSDPLVRIARLVVFAIMGLGTVFTTLLLLTIGAVRTLDVYLPGNVWSAHLLIGGIFLLAGLSLWAKRHASPEPA